MLQIFRKSLLSAVLLVLAALSILPAHAAVTVNGAATAHNFSSTIGSGVAATFTYTAPAGTVGLVMIETADTARAAVPTAFSYNGVAATLIPKTFSSPGGTGPQTSMWYLPSPPTG